MHNKSTEVFSVFDIVMDNGMPIENNTGPGVADAIAGAAGQIEQIENKSAYKTEQKYEEHLKQIGELTNRHTDDDGVAFRFKMYHADKDTVDVRIFGFGKSIFTWKGMAREKFEELIATMKNPEGQRGKLEELIGLKKKEKKDKKVKKTKDADQEDDGPGNDDATGQENLENLEKPEFSERELLFAAEYEKDARYMLKFIADIDYVGQFGYKQEDVSGAIQTETERYWKMFEKEMLEEGYFQDAKKVEQVIEKLRNDLESEQEQIEKKPENDPAVTQAGTVPEEKIEDPTKPDETVAAEQTPEKVFDINNKEQQIEMIKEGKIYYAEKMGREKNLETAFTQFEKDNQELLETYKDKDILLKVNLVDPDSPNACTDPETIKKVIEMIKKYGPKKIFIGDVPSALGKKERGWDELKQIYIDKLGYDFGSDAELINLEELENETVEAGGESFQTKKLDRFGGIINISRPKMHGQFGFTGCTKNLMGFMTQDTRDASIHMYNENYNVQEANARLSKFSEALLKNRPDMINVTDGTDFIIGHEHIGIPKETDFALVSRDPFNSDHEMVKLLGLNKARVSYLENGTFSAVDGKLSGSMERSRINPSELEQKIILTEIKPDGHPVFVYTVNDAEFLNDPEVKKRYVGVCMERLRRFIVDDLNSKNMFSEDECLKRMRNSVAGKTFEQIFGNMFAESKDEIFRNNNPYNNSNLPEFETLALEWINNQKL